MSPPAKPDPDTKTRNPGRVVLWLALITVVLALLHVVAVWIYYEDVLDKEEIGLHRWHIDVFDLDEEESFGTWFSTILLACSSWLLFAEARRARERNDPWRPWWLGLAIGFLFLSIDEVVGVHEYLNSLMEEGNWTDVGIVVVAVVFVAYLPFLWHHRWRTTILFLLAGALYVGGAVGVERATEWYAEDDLLNTLDYNLWTVVEETMEITGILVFLYVLLARAKAAQTEPAPSSTGTREAS